ncbi:N-acetylglucosamine-6-phosphate deacetylase [Microlunatus parietis]|uniref:N-acetylglucosamine-6-phosphate deacetylase n=1 Tax=Microlunatus parietis TaxID=682979 RepID=A0A7Y9L9R1_9ACTN|nr:amidohydrolase family protein [Microlunatus parietis]NYE69857.1 N-acetylglucosamine-6-phosphate deacetylase [Microlunatus parietis]
MSQQQSLTGRDPASGRPIEVRYAAGRITDVRQADAAGDAELPWLAPGLVDVQVNGFGGHDANGPDVTADAIVAMINALVRAGTTTTFATVITEAPEAMLRSLRAIAEARRQDPLTAHVIAGVHVEGPNISEQDGARGAHPAEHVRPPDLAEFEAWQQAAEGAIRMITVSPHFHAVTDYIAAVSGRGVAVSIGHTHATPEQITAAVDAGARWSTHLGNGAHATLPRHPNYLWAQLAEDRLSCGFIADGHHLPAATLTAMLRAKGLDRAYLVSDTAALAGMPPGRYRTPVGGDVVLTADGRLGDATNSYLAGAALPLAHGVAGAVRLAGLSLADALRLATGNPGLLAGGRGTLEPGGPADLILFDFAAGDPSLRLHQVVVAGNRLY